MIQDAYERYCAIEDKLDQDGEMSCLRQRLFTQTFALAQVLCQLTENQRSVICEYIGISGEINQRIVEIACFGDNV